MRKRFRPRSKPCSLCGERVSLVRCGVDTHASRKLTQRDKLTGVCNGYVYAHDSTGGIDTATCNGVEA